MPVCTPCFKKARFNLTNARPTVSADMKLQPNIGSDRSWVWKVAADYSETPPSAETLAIRFANPENANEFKKAFESGQETNAAISSGKPAPAPSSEEKEKEPAAEAEAEAEKPKEDAAAPAEEKTEESKEETKTE
ncbi:hypothetical protein HGRIS_009917 [Hohenbuehelia grisea]|uniref:RanBD1 domain-containing protein n=1 Tax=Hohenbuehelia grisea TaxID=104357 RepID=A0ABR3J2N7_9AGAR